MENKLEAWLKFQIPEEQEDFDHAKNGTIYSIIIENIDNHLRELFKHKNKTKVDIEGLREFIREQKREYGVYN